MIHYKKKSIGCCLIIGLSTLILPLAASYFYGKTFGEMIQIGVLTLMCSFAVILIYGYSAATNSLDYDNLEHIFRFLFCYEISLVLSCLFPLMDRGGWAFVCFAIACSLFSNALTASASVITFILTSTLLCDNPDIKIIIVYTIACLISIVLFRDIDENFQVSSSIIVSMLSLFVLEIAGFIFLENETLSAEQFIMPIVNIVLNSIVLFWSLKYFNEKVANKYRNKYLELNDQEYKALQGLKDLSKEEYFRSIHTAYLVERMATACDCNVFVAKNCAYYHRFKKYFQLTDEAFEEFLTENEFPPDARTALIDFSDRSKKLIEKEACFVYVSDKLISTIMKIFEKDPNAPVDYTDLIDTLMDKPFVYDALSESKLSQKDLRTIREIMKREVLYYDFLRG